VGPIDDTVEGPRVLRRCGWIRTSVSPSESEIDGRRLMTEQTADPRPSLPRADVAGLSDHRSAIQELARDLQVSETEVLDAYASELQRFVDARVAFPSRSWRSALTEATECCQSCVENC
jgi:hypothetical protein